VDCTVGAGTANDIIGNLSRIRRAKVDLIYLCTPPLDAAVAKVGVVGVYYEHSHWQSLVRHRSGCMRGVYVL
jgi:hypothetical protein